ncbi:MAG: hypothetical protein HN742_31170 [Lentisphaerae bacterium]|jgi:hypothetical protein|nr:hypothetical protein [Lentisphaerota bacterium]MBT4816482.1 hypothetical protein [Lentisphaerota bacterium]MBT5612035.1 hypothetical protein [Lentisphaerota bacterium]MBT7054783.1 hypothetical protein [Lentisphaerota bacterium]MBT7846372.1 hypothetical protein [Lentisphaerota bacterium]
MKITSDFECGNGKNIVELAPGHWRLDEVGEKAPYCKYFCVRIDGEEDGGPVRLDIYPDPDLGEAGRAGMMGHYPSPLWYSENAMERWLNVTKRWPGVETYGDDHISTQVVVPPNRSTYVASNVVLSWSMLRNWAASPATQGAVVDALGTTSEGREIPRLHIPPLSADGAHRVFVFSGQHPSEHCGPLAACGIAEFLCSSHPEARAIREHTDVWIVPMINVDGNVHGRNGWTMEDVNPYPDFEGACDGREPEATEDRLLWHWLVDELRPELCLNFHGFLGQRSFVEFPHDGFYVLQDPASVYTDPARCALYETVRDTLFWDTPGLTGAGNPGPLGPQSLAYNLARYCGAVVPFYEINHGFHGVYGAKRKGVDVFRATMRAMGCG